MANQFFSKPFSQLELNNANFLDKVYSKEEYLVPKETRDFGLSDCIKAVEDVFSPEIFRDWDSLTPEPKAAMVKEYANKVAEAFKLNTYKGVFFEEMYPGLLGYNNGDGSIHLNEYYLTNNRVSPIELIDTITHELRHQYQYEAVQGLHNIPDDVRNEWTVGFENYTTDSPYVYDPWGYMYNPLEIDSNYASNTVVRELTKDMINGKWA